MYIGLVHSKRLILQEVIQSIADLACPYIVVCGCVEKTQMLKGERVGLQFNLFKI
jgi:hypothetical protein